ncbi:serine/threonine-protein phosphatase [Nocardioides currus]|uniref:Serine/threonine-protein phosphatase n=1 Tax=Nocardioides currus TaxID=2133958 RepID=A0A2R7YV53_9ACTN|nr:serine/threonine-protein phosphatase [Nocardioides currus]
MENWRTGSRSSQVYVLCVLLVAATACFVAAWVAFDVTPSAVWFVLLLLGVLVLRSVPLALLSCALLVGATAVAVHDGAYGGRVVTSLVLLALCVLLVVQQSTQQRSGLPAALSEPMLAQLRDRLQAQGRVPTLPSPWRSQSAMLTSHGSRYAGDFLVADLRQDRELEMVLVDVCGKGVTVGPQALQFAGALGGLVGALPPDALMRAANTFLLRQDSDESFATAVHLLVDLTSGDYTITSAGHPPVLHWAAELAQWDVDNARGTALGVVPDPELHASTGTLAPGEALMFYTDGVIETRGRDLDDGITWLRDVATHRVLTRGFDGVARSILRDVPRGDDDRAVLVLERISR